MLLLAVSHAACTEDEPYVRALSSVEEPAFDYGLYCDTRGTLVGEDSAVLLVRRPSHLERVYADARHGEARAREVFRQLEETFVLIGQQAADAATSVRCLALPLRGCVTDWAFVDRFMTSRGPGAQHLRLTLARTFEQRAQRRGLEKSIIVSSLNLLLAGGTAMAVMKEVAAEGEAAGSELQAGTESQLAMVSTDAEALAARLLEEEALATGPRHPAAPSKLARLRPALDNPPEGTASGDAMWSDYVAYWEQRYAELAGKSPTPAGAPKPKPPLTWDAYHHFQDTVLRGSEFQRSVSEAMRWELTLPEAQRHLVPNMKKPLLAENVGVARTGRPQVLYPDQLVVDEATLKPGTRPHVEAFSNKSRDFNSMSKEQIREQAVLDADEALTKYGGILQVRRAGHPLFGQEVTVSKVHLVYDAAMATEDVRGLLEQALRRKNVEIHFHEPQ
ncbi:hypothetical protein [Archangium sp.]|uniref:hypothetical protein n=1 Tax=Archangium sp. TaxID=1872627 RepID=UPI00389A32C3